MEPIDRATVWPYDEHGDPGEFVYQRYAHPTGAAAERALGRLEGGRALLYASGTSAVTACVFAFCRPGMTVALAEGSYFGTGVTLAQFEPWGLEVVEFDQTGAPPAGADVLWLEAPANPLLTLPDWEAVRAHPALVVCDATIATPVFLHALDHGADIALHSATKYLTGHSNAMLGATVTRKPEQAQALYDVRLRLGLAASPDSAAALLQGLETLRAARPPPDRDRAASWRPVSRRTRQCSAFATRASVVSSSSTWRTTMRGRSRRRRP